MKYWEEIDFWNTKLHWKVTNIKSTMLHEGNSGSKVYRIELKGNNIPKSVILKETYIPKHRSILCLDKNSWKREALFYKHVSELRTLNTAELYHFEINYKTKQTLLIIEDLSRHYYIPHANHQWTNTEKSVILDTYINLDSLTKQFKNSKMDLSYLAVPEYIHVTPIDIIESVRILDNWQPTKMLIAYIKPAIDSIINKLNTMHNEYKTLPVTLSYNDFYPGNIAMSYKHDLAVLFDFQLIGWGNALNNMLNAFGSSSFGDDKKDLQMAYLKAVKFKNNTSFNLTQLLTINDLLSSLYMIWVMGCYASQFPDNINIPKWFNYVISDLPKQVEMVEKFIN